MRTIFSFSLLLCLLLGACNEATSIDLEKEEEVSGLCSIAYLKAQASNGERVIDESLVIQGIVTSTDRLGEFNRQLIIEDESGAILINIELAELYRRYPIGSQLEIYCCGLRLRNYGGRIELGGETDLYQRYGLREEELDRYIRTLTPAASAPQPRAMTFETITAQEVACYVRFDNVQFTESGIWCDEDSTASDAYASEHTITDPAGNRFTVRTLATCHYAKEPLPSGKGSLYGIIDYFNGRYSLRVVNYGVRF